MKINDLEMNSEDIHSFAHRRCAKLGMFAVSRYFGVVCEHLWGR